MDSQDRASVASADEDLRPSLGQLLRQFAFGLGYLFFGSGVVAAISAEIISTFAPQPPRWWPLFGRTLAAMVAGTLLLALVLLIGLVRWSAGPRNRKRQFGLVSLFLTMALLAAYLALVRWLVADIWPGEPPLWGFAAMGAAVLLVLIVGFIPLLYWMHSLVWLAARLVRMRPVRRWLVGRRGH